VAAKALLGPPRRLTIRDASAARSVTVVRRGGGIVGAYRHACLSARRSSHVTAAWTWRNKDVSASMHITARKERFNRAYVGALAAQAGINSATPEVDNDSVDIMFIGRDFPGMIREPQICFQLKCTHQNLRVGENIRFSLGRKNYDDLRDVRVGVPRYLAVLEVPENCEDWSHHIDKGMLLRSRCYWVSLKGLPSVDQESITVSVPLAQRLTSTTLAELLSLASERRDA
jgi:hypothetical protein